MSAGTARITVAKGFGLFVGGVLRQGGETVEVDPATAEKWTGLGWCTIAAPPADDKPAAVKTDLTTRGHGQQAMTTGKPKPKKAGTGNASSSR